MVLQWHTTKLLMGRLEPLHTVVDRTWCREMPLALRLSVVSHRRWLLEPHTLALSKPHRLEPHRLLNKLGLVWTRWPMAPQMRRPPLEVAPHTLGLEVPAAQELARAMVVALAASHGVSSSGVVSVASGAWQ